MNDWARQQQKKIAETASHMLPGAVSYIRGARRIAGLRFDAALETDPDILPFVGVDSETDALPIETDVRKLWSPEALEKLQLKIDSAESWARSILEPHCRSLFARL
jgi:hypothetical protein